MGDEATDGSVTFALLKNFNPRDFVQSISR